MFTIYIFGALIPGIFIPRPTKWGRVVLTSHWMFVCPSRGQMSTFLFSEQNSVTQAWISLIFDTYPLGGVDVPFGVFEILPT